MSEFIDREKAIANIKAAYCCGCENYNGIRCRACQIMDAMDVLEDEPAAVPDVQRWRKTAEEPPTEKDSAHGNVLVKYMDATFAQSATWDTVARRQIFSRFGCRCLSRRVGGEYADMLFEYDRQRREAEKQCEQLAMERMMKK